MKLNEKHSLSSINSIVFDFDGVLIDSNVAKRDAYFEIFATLDNGESIVAEVLQQITDGDRYEIISVILRKSSCSLQDNELRLMTSKYAQMYNRICEDFAITCPEMYGALEALKKLSLNFKLYINSATPEKPLNRIVQKRNWSKHFEGVLGRPRTKFENLKLIIEKEKIQASQMVFIGDQQGDLDAADKIRCEFIGVLTSTSVFLQIPRTTIDNPGGLLELLAL